ncbi:alpha/beta hydrolase [Pseudonocardia sp. NPDC049635]|uniref:alpha/beta hydrolase n=1 Tax=Pseudonocardia sp. NPDC049635 TaxID=3155506 RepID=UPI0033C3FE05
MLSLHDLLAADPGAWLRRARAWDALSHRLTSRVDDLDRSGIAALPERWAGADADRAREGNEALRSRLVTDAALAARAGDVLGTHAGEVLTAQRRIVQAALGVNPLLDVDLTTGTVSVPATVRGVAAAVLPFGGPALTGLLAAESLRFGAAVRSALADAARSDAAATAALRALRPSAAGSGSVVAPAGAAAARAWWSDLPDDERDRLTRTRPDLVGGTDGIPPSDRDRANRSRLDAERSRLRALADQLRMAGDEGGAERAEADLAGLDAVHGRLAATDALLLHLTRGSGNGQVVLAVGDPERAAHVVTHVPGTGAGWASAAEDLRRVDATRDAARGAAPDGEVAAVLWTGYDAPADLSDAIDDRGADRAAVDLRRFQDALRTGHDGPVHLTTVGHSYGSLVLGRAAGPGIAADDVVFVGSPGVGVGHASELGVPVDRVWATTAANDPIRLAAGSEVFSTSRGFGPAGLIHGPDPSRAGFGAAVFDSAPGPLGRALADDPTTPTDESEWMSAHSSYWDPGTPGLDTIGRIVAGTTGGLR